MLGFYLDDPVQTAWSAKTPNATPHDRLPGSTPVVADLLALAVLPAHQSKGIGTKLLLHVIEVAERVAPQSRITSLRLTVAETNTGAQRLYARNGFRVVDGSATYDRGQRALRMARTLSAAT
jgi:ribosomal protein S18 acetylase RimI-like enzyme